MDVARGGRRIALVALFVALASLLGLLPVMARGGLAAFVDVWTASLWADVAFVAGMATAATVGAEAIGRAFASPPGRIGAVLALPLLCLFCWATFVVSFVLMLDGFLGEARFLELSMAEATLWEWAVWRDVVGLGWPGLVWSVAAPTTAGIISAKRRQAPDYRTDALHVAQGPPRMHQE